MLDDLFQPKPILFSLILLSLTYHWQFIVLFPKQQTYCILLINSFLMGWLAIIILTNHNIYFWFCEEIHFGKITYGILIDVDTRSLLLLTIISPIHQHLVNQDN